MFDIVSPPGFMLKAVEQVEIPMNVSANNVGAKVFHSHVTCLVGVIFCTCAFILKM